MWWHQEVGPGEVIRSPQWGACERDQWPHRRDSESSLSLCATWRHGPFPEPAQTGPCFGRLASRRMRNKPAVQEPCRWHSVTCLNGLRPLKSGVSCTEWGRAMDPQGSPAGFQELPLHGWGDGSHLPRHCLGRTSASPSPAHRLQ